MFACFAKYRVLQQQSIDPSTFCSRPGNGVGLRDIDFLPRCITCGRRRSVNTVAHAGVFGGSARLNVNGGGVS
jgi:hypothetical protein